MAKKKKCLNYLKLLTPAQLAQLTFDSLDTLGWTTESFVRFRLDAWKESPIWFSVAAPHGSLYRLTFASTQLTAYTTAQSGYVVTVAGEGSWVKLPQGISKTWRRLARVLGCVVIRGNNAYSKQSRIVLSGIDPQVWPTHAVAAAVAMSLAFRLDYEPLKGVGLAPVLIKWID